MIIAGAVYKSGVALTADGAIYLKAIASGEALPSGNAPCKGSDIPFGKVVDADGQLLARFV